MFQKKAPKGIEPKAGEEGQAPITKVKKPMKKKKGKPKKTSTAKEGQKGKIAAMLGSKFTGKDLAFSGKGKTCGCKGDCNCNEKFEGGKRGQVAQFVPEQKRTGIKG